MSPEMKSNPYDRSLDDVLDELDATREGLSDDEAKARLEKHGPNELPHGSPPSRLKIFIAQFKSPLIYVLAAAALVAVAVGETTDAGFIVAILVLNALIGGFEEFKAEQSAQALQQLIRTIATVIRGGETREIDATKLVPGDILLLESGNRVPADARFIDTQSLEIDEALLTGESLPVVKDADWMPEGEAPIGDQLNTAFAGSSVVRGRGRAVVTATGTHTVVGQLAADVTDAEAGKPPLVERMERFTRVVGYVSLVAAGAVAMLGFTAGFELQEMFLFGIALAVSIIPEGLPVAMTVALAVATTRMAKRGVIVRKLAAVEGLGSCTMIASDKTGTLTRNELTVARFTLAGGFAHDIEGGGYIPIDRVGELGDHTAGAEQLARAVALCNEASLYHHEDEWVWRGDPTEIALLTFAHKVNLEPEELRREWPQVGEIPFEAERKFAATFHRKSDSESVLGFVKGAPEVILDMSQLDSATAAREKEVAERLASEGFRVLGVAQAYFVELPGDDLPRGPDATLEFLGFVAMIDPLREGVIEAIKACNDAGIKVSMVTGDHPVTALAIARNLGFAQSHDEVITGAQLDDATFDDPKVIERTRVYARVAPEQKLDIVNAAQKAGHYVAVTGDGVNDAPALRAANIGVAMGKGGTDVAREAADLVISDDNFSTIVNGVEEGRVAYDNVRKVIYLLVSTGAAEVVLMLLALAAGMPLPLVPVQILWLNLVTNGIQDVALAFEPAERDVLARKPREPNERIFNRLMIERTIVAAVTMGGVGFAAFYWLIESGWEETHARNAMLLLMVLFENVHLGNCRSETQSIFTLAPWKSPILLAGAALAFGLHIGSMHWGFMQSILGTAPIDLETFAILCVFALSIAVTMELHKVSWRLRYPRP